MFWFDFNWQIQHFLNQLWWPINFLLLIVAGLVAYLAYRKPIYALATTIVLLPTYLFRSQISFGPITFLELLIWLTFFGWLFSLVAPGWELRALGSKLKAQSWQNPILLILLASSIGVLIAPDLRAAAGLWKAYFIEPILFFLVLINVFKTEKDKKTILWALGISSLTISLLAIYQKFTAFGIAEAGWIAVSHRRVTSIFTSPNAVGLYLGPIIAIYFGWLMAEIKNLKISLLKLAIISPAILAVIFTVSQGAWLGLLAAIIFLAFFGWNKKWTAIIVAAAIIIVLIMPLSRNNLLPLITLQDASGQNRLTLWQISFDYLSDSLKNFIFGAGIFGFPLLHEQIRDPLQTEPLIYPHNIILNFWLEIGLLGLIAFVWLLVKFFRRGFQQLKTKNQQLITVSRGLTLGIMAAMITVIIHGSLDVPYFKNDLSVLFWLIISMI